MDEFEKIMIFTTGLSGWNFKFKAQNLPETGPFGLYDKNKQACKLLQEYASIINATNGTIDIAGAAQYSASLINDYRAKKGLTFEEVVLSDEHIRAINTDILHGVY